MGGSNEIGARIKELREKHGMTQTELAEKLFTSRETVNMWERGARDIKTGTIIALAKALKTNCDYLLTGVDTENVIASDLLGLTNETMHALVNLKACTKICTPHPLVETSKALLDGINSLISNEYGRNIIYRVYSYLQINTANLYTLLPDDPEKPNEKQGFRTERIVCKVDAPNSGFTSINIPLEAFEAAYLLDLVDVIKKWKREREERNAQESNP